MSINDELCRQRNSEIANDNYHNLKWLNEAVDKFLSRLAEALAMESQNMPRPKFTLDEVNEWADEMRKCREKA